MSERRGVAGAASDGVRSGAPRSATVGRWAPEAERDAPAEREVGDGRSGAPLVRGFGRLPGAACDFGAGLDPGDFAEGVGG